MKTRDRLVNFLLEWQIDSPHFNHPGDIADALIKAKIVNNYETLEEQVPHIYRWTAVEDDGYTHSEAGVANNMLEAFVKATEYSPSYHNKIAIEKIPDEELTVEEIALKEFWTK